jgi:hypothetical protein
MDETVVTGVLAERTMDDGRRKIKLRADERAMFNRQAMIERAVVLFLDTQADHIWDAIAVELGISVMALKDLTKTQEFMDVYDVHFTELGHDPRTKGARAALADMLPMAVRQLKALLSAGETPASVKMKAIEKIFELNGVGPAKGTGMDRNELMNFLKDANVTLTQNNTTISLPPNPYEGNIDAYVNGRWSDIQAHHANSVAGSIMDDQSRENDEFPAMESEP